VKPFFRKLSPVDAIKTVLSELKGDEAFFSIDEFGPFAVKMRGGNRHATVAPLAGTAFPGGCFGPTLC
jgi:hypothetical protein